MQDRDENYLEDFRTNSRLKIVYSNLNTPAEILQSDCKLEGKKM